MVFTQLTSGLGVFDVPLTHLSPIAKITKPVVNVVVPVSFVVTCIL